MQVQSLGQEDPLEKGMATHSSILAWGIHMDRGAQRATVQRVAESDTTEATLHAAPKEYQRLWKLKQHTHVRKHKGTGKG